MRRQARVPRPPVARERIDAWTVTLAQLHAALRDAADDDPAPPPERALARDSLLEHGRALRRALRRLRLALIDAAEVRALLANAPPASAGLATDEALAAHAALLAELRAELPDASEPRREFYVYLHRDAAGRVFYVGKGRARRAWSRARTAVWHRYVDGVLGGDYAVEIHARDLTHAQALALESELMAQHGPALVNWLNRARTFDADSVQRAQLLRADTLARVGTTAFIEAQDPEEALRRYARALDDVRRYARMPVEHGLLGRLKDADRRGEPLVLDRYTRCLARLGRDEELRAVAQAYFAEFPDAVRTPAGERARRRAEAASRARLRPRA